MTSAVLIRYAAFHILERILHQQKTLEMALDDVLGRYVDMPEPDRAFVRAIVMMVLRRQGQLDRLIRLVMPKELPARRMSVRTILYIGAAGLFFMDVPPHACVDTAVEVTKEIGLSSFGRLVNGVLRTLARRPELLAQTDEAQDNLPAWMWQRWCQIYGESQARAFSQAALTEPMLDITVKENPEAWAACWQGTVLSPGGTVRLIPQPVKKLKGYAEGAWWVQEASAALPAQVLPTTPGMRVADLCAAPGGKTAQLAMKGACVDAFDISERRLLRLRENLERLKLTQSVRVFVGDAQTFHPREPYAAVLLDAPCSATGTLQRHPDIKIHRTLADIQRLAQMQYRLLEKAVEGTQIGGMIIFSTCSLEPEEGELLIEHFLSEHLSVVREPITEPIFASWATSVGDLRCLPTQGRDGFFVARLKRLC